MTEDDDDLDGPLPSMLTMLDVVDLLELADAEPDPDRRDALEARARAIRERIEEAWGGADRMRVSMANFAED